MSGVTSLRQVRKAPPLPALLVVGAAVDSLRVLTYRPSSGRRQIGKLVVWSGATFERFNPTPGGGAALVLGR